MVTKARTIPEYVSRRNPHGTAYVHRLIGIVDAVDWRPHMDGEEWADWLATRLDGLAQVHGSAIDSGTHIVRSVADELACV